MASSLDNNDAWRRRVGAGQA